MLSRRSRLSFVGLCCAVLAVGLGFDRPEAPGQNKKPVILPGEGSNQLREQVKLRDNVSRMKTLREGAETPKPEDQKVLDLFAQHYAYRFTWPEHQERTGAAAGVLSVGGLLDSLETELKQAARFKPANQAFVDQFFKMVAQRLNDVLQTEKPIATVNAARALALMVNYGLEDATDVLIAALKTDDLNDGAKVHALKGLKAQLARWNDAPPTTAAAKERQRRCVAALIDCIERKPPFDVKNVALREERQGLREGLRWFRREAVRSLGQSAAPGLTDDKGALTMRSALSLLKVMNNEDCYPSARLDEQVDAAVAVAQMKHGLLPAYQPDYAAYQIGVFVVEFAARAANRINADDWEKALPWKLHAIRLDDALEQMGNDTRNHTNKATATYVGEVVKRSRDVLKDVQSTQSSTRTPLLQAWLDSNAPAAKSVYAGVADAVVKPLAKSEDEDDRAAPTKKPDATKKPATPAKKPDDKKGGAGKKP